MNKERCTRMMRELHAEPATGVCEFLLDLLLAKRPASQLALVVLGATLLAAGIASAGEYPNRPIKVVVPWPAGQSTDLVARIVVEKLAAALGQQMVIENHPGASGVAGTQLASKAAPDGYTILAGSSGPISISPSVQRVPYDPDKDFDPICLMANTPYVLVTHPAMPVSNAKELIALLRAQPGKYTFASSGTGATSHLVTELFNTAAQVTATHVPYKGSAAALTDLVEGRVSYAFETASTVVPHVKAGRLKALGTSSARPALVFPDLPPLAEAAELPGFDVRGWVGLLAPAGVPREIRARIAAECRKVVEAPEVRERFLARGTETAAVTPEEFGRFIRQQNERFAAIAGQANIKLD